MSYGSQRHIQGKLKKVQFFSEFWLVYFCFILLHCMNLLEDDNLVSHVSLWNLNLAVENFHRSLIWA